jgi:hypothetical protein
MRARLRKGSRRNRGADQGGAFFCPIEPENRSKMFHPFLTGLVLEPDGDPFALD